MKTSTPGTHASGVLFGMLCLILSVGLCIVPAQDQRSDASRQRLAVPASRKVFVHSKSLLVSAAVVEDKLLKQPEFQQRGFVITRNIDDADIVIELRHDLLTKYVFTVIEMKSQRVVAGGKLSSIGGTVAEKVAKRFIKEINLVSQP
ncbi:MAG TPA: hypothetical protein VN476_05440 [Pyrinomonadaceae bacterium]|nr:hypothetical protein [Pyrinomonadaceae bacterium]